MKNSKRVIVLLLVVAMLSIALTSLTACGQTEKVKIGVGFYSESSDPVNATKAYLDYLGEELNVEFTYVTFSSRDAEENLTKAQSLISSGVQGIITTVDAGTEAILEECAAAGVYLAGYINDFSSTYKIISASDYKHKEYFLGSTVDGISNGTKQGALYAETIIKSPYRVIGMTKFPAFAFASHTQQETEFVRVINEYNSKNPNDQITLTPTQTLQFSALPSTYFNDYPNLEAIVSFCSGLDFVYPTMVTAGKTNVKLFSGGYSSNSDMTNNFGTKGNGCIQRVDFSAAETVLYSLVMLLNKIDGKVFADNPATAEKIDVMKVVISNNAELDAVMTKCIYHTKNVEDALYDAKQVKKMLARNGGTYENLLKALEGMNISAYTK